MTPGATTEGTSATHWLPNAQCPMPNATLRVSQLDTEGEANLHWSYENLFIEAGA